MNSQTWEVLPTHLKHFFIVLSGMKIVNIGRGLNGFNMIILKISLKTLSGGRLIRNKDSLKGFTEMGPRHPKHQWLGKEIFREHLLRNWKQFQLAFDLMPIYLGTAHNIPQSFNNGCQPFIFAPYCFKWLVCFCVNKKYNV